MADKDPGEDGPSLEMPTLGSLLRRKKGRKKDDPSAPEPQAAPEAGPEDGPSGEPTDDLAPTAEEFDAIGRGKAARPTDEATPEDDTAPTPEAAQDVPEETKPLFADEVSAEPEPDPSPEPAPDSEQTTEVAASDEPEQPDHADPEHAEPAEEPEPETEHTAVLTSPGTRRATRTERPPKPKREPKPEREPRPKRELTLPPLAARVAAALTGAVVGLLAVALTYLGLRGCEAVQGTSSCGSPGFVLLLAIMVGLIVIGSSLLGAWRVPDAPSTSFLAVGLLAVIALLFLIEVIFSVWMILVIPLVSIGTFCLSQWVTSLILDETD